MPILTSALSIVRPEKRIVKLERLEKDGKMKPTHVRQMKLSTLTPSQSQSDHSENIWGEDAYSLDHHGRSANS